MRYHGEIEMKTRILRNKDISQKKKQKIKFIKTENTNIESIAHQPSSAFKTKLFEKSSKLINSMDDPIKIFKKFIKNP